MSVRRRRIGETLNLDLQLAIDENDKTVVANLYSFSGVFISSVDLTNAGGGLYTEGSEVMPNLDQLKVQYVVYDDAGKTVESCKHGRGQDVYEKMILEPVQFPDDAIVGEVKDNESVTGSVEEGSVAGTVEENDKPVGSVREDAPVGTVKKGSIVGEVGAGSVKGTVDEC